MVERPGVPTHNTVHSRTTCSAADLDAKYLTTHFNADVTGSKFAGPIVLSLAGGYGDVDAVTVKYDTQVLRVVILTAALGAKVTVLGIFDVIANDRGIGQGGNSMNPPITLSVLDQPPGKP